MGTRADFYVGRGKDAEWIGSIAWDGYEFDQSDDHPISIAKSEEEFVQAIEKTLECRDDATFPKNGWPWPWEDSNTTDYAYAWDDGKIWVSIFGSNWYEIGNRPEHEENHGKEAIFPDMSDIQNLTFGKRSGLIVING